MRYRLKTPYRDGTTHIVLEPLDFIARLAARGQGARSSSAEAEAPPLARHVALSWARRLKRVFAIEIERCCRCGGRLEVIASIEEPALIERILAHLTQRACEEQKDSPFVARAPPQPSLF